MGICIQKNKKASPSNNILQTSPTEKPSLIIEPNQIQENLPKPIENLEKNPKKLIKKKKSLKKKKKTQTKTEFPIEVEIQAVQDIIKQKKSIIKKRNQELREIALYSDENKPTGSPTSSVRILDERIQRILEKNNAVAKNFDQVNQELESYSVGLRKGSVFSEEIKDSVRNALSRMAEYDKDIMKLQNSNKFTLDKCGLSPLKVNKCVSRVLKTSEIKEVVESPYFQLRKLLEEKNNEMDQRHILAKQMKNGKEDDEKIIEYKQKIKKELQIMQFSNEEQFENLNSAIILVMDSPIRKQSN